MAEGELMNHPLVLPLETQFPSEGPGMDGGMEKLDIYLKFARGCMEAVRGMSSLKFNNEQCGYLTQKLEAVVQSAISFVEGSHAQAHRPYSSVDIARWVGTLKLLVGLAKQIESFVQGCCKEAWMPAAMTLANVAEYVSSLGFNLELCRVALCKELAATGSLTLDEVGKMNRDEMEIVKAKASIDAVDILQKVTFELNSSKAEDCILAKYLLHRLVRVGPKPTSDDDSILVKLFEWVALGRKAEQLGKGSSAKVYKVMWLGTPVAKKTFYGPENQEFLQEVRILSQLCHPNITSMFCCSMNKRSCSIIMELMDGSLHDMMQSRLEENGDSPPFPILEGVDIMLQVGEGVNYLHGRRIVHRDLKSMNILVKTLEASGLEPGYVQAKVVDFGLSKTKERSTTYSNMTYNMGTFRWMAPEVMNLVPGSQGGGGGRAKFPKHQFKCDIYSFVMVCFEILTGEVPFQCEGTSTDIKKKVLGGLRPKLPDYCPSMLKSLIEKCWSQEPTERPTIGDVCLQLKHLKYLLLTSEMFQGCYTLHMMEPFEVVYLNIKNLPWASQIQVNIFSSFLKELLLVPNGAISVDGAQLFHMQNKLDIRRAVCANKVESSGPSSSADSSRNKGELQLITELVHSMDKEFKEIKTMYAAMEEKRCATWDMLWAFFPPGEMVVCVDKLTNKRVRGEVLWTNYQETEEGPMLFVNVTRDSNSQTWSKYLFSKVLHMPSNEETKKAWNKYGHTVTVPAFQGDRAFGRLDVYPDRLQEDPKVAEGSLLHRPAERTGQVERLQFIEAPQLSIAKIRVGTDSFGLVAWIGEGSYTRVYLDSGRALEHIRSEIGSLTALKTLSFDGCRALELLPSEIGSLTTLETLSFVGCRALELLPSEIGSLTALETLSFDGCRALELLPSEIGSLTALKTLSLDRCWVLKRLPSEIGNLTALETLNLNGCDALELLPSEIGSLTALKTLSLDRCWVLKRVPSEIGNLTALETLNLNGWHALELLPSEIGSLTALKTLSLNGCRALELLPSEIGSLTALKTLSLTGCRVLKRLPSEVGNLTALETLRLDSRRALELLPSEMLPSDIGNSTALKILRWTDFRKLK